MVILFFSRLFYPHIGGVEKHMERVSQELIKLGHQVTVVTEQYDPTTLKLRGARKGIKIYRIPTWDVSEKDKKWRIWHWLWQQRDLIRQSDVIHIHDVFFWYLPFRFLFPQRKVFITFHGYETKFPPSASAIWQKRLAAALTAANICVGAYIGKWYGIKPTLVTYGATDLGQRPIGPWPKKPAVIILGRPSPDNNIDEVRTALRYSGAKVTTHLQQASIVIASSYLSIWEGLAAGRQVLSIYTNPLKKDYLQPLAKYIHIANSTPQLSRLIRKYTSGVYLGKTWANLPTWDKITQQYLKLWQL